jgi:hypothetical protein
MVRLILARSKLLFKQLTFPGVVCTADVDNDGFIDLVSASTNPRKLVWFKNKGDDTFNEPSLITNEISNASLVYTADMDTDGDADVVYIYRPLDGGYYYDHIYWAENDGTAGNFNNFHDVYYVPYINSFNISDLDNDGDVDLVANHDYATIGCILNDGTGNFTISQNIESNGYGINNIHTIDLDNDGYKDILFTNYYNANLFFTTKIMAMALLQQKNM